MKNVMCRRPLHIFLPHKPYFFAVFFFAAGGLSTFLKAKLGSNIPLYVFAFFMAGVLYLFYRIRLVGYRYTVFHSEPETEYDPRFDEFITHEDYPYPVGSIVFERTVSAKGTIIEVVKKEELTAFLDAGTDYSSDSEIVCGPAKKEKSASVVFAREGKHYRIYFSPSEQFISYIKTILAEKE